MTLTLKAFCKSFQSFKRFLSVIFIFCFRNYSLSPSRPSMNLHSNGTLRHWMLSPAPFSLSIPQKFLLSSSKDLALVASVFFFFNRTFFENSLFTKEEGQALCTANFSVNPMLLLWELASFHLHRFLFYFVFNFFINYLLFICS